jgi:hypothetical protein
VALPVQEYAGVPVDIDLDLTGGSRGRGAPASGECGLPIEAVAGHRVFELELLDQLTGGIPRRGDEQVPRCRVVGVTMPEAGGLRGQSSVKVHSPAIRSPDHPGRLNIGNM